MVKRAGKIITEPVDLNADPEAVGWLTSQGEYPAILETLQVADYAGRFSIFAADPLRVVACGPDLENPIEEFVRHANGFAGSGRPPCEIPFGGGWVGHLSYEAGVPARLVKERESGTKVPLLHFGLYDHALVLDHQTDRWWATAVEWPDDQTRRPSSLDRIERLRRRVQEAQTIELPDIPEPGRPVISTAMTRVQFLGKVRRIKEYIEAGDIYQANLAQRFHVKTPFSPFDVYRRARGVNPAPYAAFLGRGDYAIMSASPELFLHLRDGVATTRPIKGTCPRSSVEAIDAVRCEELCRSEKEVAELNMIIDLLRNDFGRVCTLGSIKVLDAGTVEAHPTVFHRVATIQGRLAPERNWSDLVEATFPCGSIAGAPKIRAMQIIRELEPFVRGPYCGAIGWIGLDGNMTLNVAIRTIVCRNGAVDVFAGAGIVAESDPESEYEEVLAKAAGLLASLGIGPETKRTEKVADLATHE